MTRFADVFPRRPAILPVIHVESADQALRNAGIARGAGCDGVFLINHAGPCPDLLAVHQVVATEFPGWWIGVNCLDMAPASLFAVIGQEVSGVWVDNAGIDDSSDSQDVAEHIALARRASGWQGLYFGGVAFKYQRPVADLERASVLATRYMDVLTTSGPGTGQAAQVAKIQTMRQAIGDFPLAIASGITPENAGDYAAISDCFLVATGISKNWRELDPERVRKLVTIVRDARTSDAGLPTEAA
jgi:hypothetical protein